MKIGSEQTHLAALKRFHDHNDTYRACVAVANNGMRLSEEDGLDEIQQKLLDARRLLFASKFDNMLMLLKSFKAEEVFLEGDRLFLLGQYYHRTGKQSNAADLMGQAADCYQHGGDIHRELRARANGAICISTLESCLYGDLYIFEQESRKAGFNDITANICRTRAMELMANGKFQESMSQSLEASQLYLIDGYQDDNSVALALAAISALITGDLPKAIEFKSKVLVREGKVTVYLNAFESLTNGKLPVFPEGHSMNKVDWKKHFLKPDSIPGKIIRALREKPRTRNELIEFVWGENALSESYCGRLYVAVNAIRKERGINIVFDGEAYKIA